MSSEQKLLSLRDIEAAEHAANFSHPILDVLTSHEQQILALQDQCKPIIDTDEEQSFLEQNFGFIAKSIAEIDNFSLTPTELVSLWSRDIIKGMSRYQKYTLARIIASCYSVQDLDNDEWKQFPVKVTEEFQQAHIFLLERPDVFEAGEQMNERINELNNNVRLLSKTGHTIYPTQKWKDTTINEITENFGNAVLPIRMLIESVIG